MKMFLDIVFRYIQTYCNFYFYRIQEQLRRIKRNQEKEKEKALQPKKKKEKPPNSVRTF